MIMDNQLLFSNAFSMALTQSVGSTVIDLEGGVAENIGVGTRFGADMGIGDGVAIPKVAAFLASAMLSTNSATLQVQFQGSTNSTNWSTYVETPVLTTSNLIAGAKIAAFDWPLVPAGVSLPRYIRLNYVVATGVFTTGSITSGIVLQRDDWPLPQYPAGFSVGP